MSDQFNTDESRLLSLLKQKNEAAFEILVRRYQNRIFHIAYGITLDREESLDIVQDVFLKVCEHIHTFKAESSLWTWLRRITVNQSLNRRRRWRRRFRWHHQPLEREDGKASSELGTDEYDPEALYQRNESERMLWEKMNTLPEDARTIFILREAEGLSYDEIARILKIKRGTVSSRLFYARQRLKAALQEDTD